MSVSLEELASRIHALEDVAAIKDLKARYLRACDLRHPEEVRDCFVPKGAVIAYEGFPAFDDREPFVEIFAQMGCRPGLFDMHHASNPQIELTGPDSAKGKWALYFNSIDTGARTVLQMGCEYDDEYVRQDGRWWISATATRRTSFLMQKIDDAGAPVTLVLGESAAAYGEADPA